MTARQLSQFPTWTDRQMVACITSLYPQLSGRLRVSSTLYRAVTPAEIAYAAQRSYLPWLAGKWDCTWIGAALIVELARQRRRREPATASPAAFHLRGRAPGQPAGQTHRYALYRTPEGPLALYDPTTQQHVALRAPAYVHDVWDT